ncbi:MAG: iron-only hydrogenase system regulator [Ruminococcaceae bacterium]|nr:iron-only hydrogenase system regulator [Oscillospiraceae bacterium]
METKVAVISIILENQDAVEPMNALLHEYGSHIIGRMGIPYKARNMNVISIALDAELDTINELTSKIDALPGVGAKTVVSA